MKHTLLAVALAGLLAACAAPQNPQQAVFQTKQSYATTLAGAVAYTKLPRCAPAKPVHPCSDPVVIGQLQKADNVASAALDSAEQAVRTPGFGKDIVNTAVTAANSALSALAALVANLGASK